MKKPPQSDSDNSTICMAQPYRFSSVIRRSIWVSNAYSHFIIYHLTARYDCSAVERGVKVYGPAIPYFFGYKKELLSFLNDPKNLDPSYKTDLDLCYCLRRVKLVYLAKFHRTDLVSCSHSRERKLGLIAE